MFGRRAVDWKLPLAWRSLALAEITTSLQQLRMRKRPTPPVRVLLGAVDGADGDALRERWKEAVQAVLDLDTSYRWGSGPHRRKIEAVAGLPRIVEELRAVVVVEPRAPLDWLAALVAEGSDESADAILPHIDAAFQDGGEWLESVNQLKRFARTATMTRLFDEGARRVAARRAVSPALDFAESLGLPRRKRFFFDISLDAVDKVRGLQFWFHVAVDSRRTEWLDVTVSQRDLRYGHPVTTAFGAADLRSDELRLGRCEPAELPSYAARAAAALGVEWRVSSVKSSERGASRDQIERWLLPAPTVPRRVTPAQELAARIGLSPRQRVRFNAQLASVEKRDGRSVLFGDVTVNSVNDRWFRIFLVHRSGHLEWTDESSAAEFLAREARRLAVKLEVTRVDYLKTDEERERVRRWLLP